MELGTRLLAKKMDCHHGAVIRAVQQGEKLRVLNVERGIGRARSSYQIDWEMLAIPPRKRPEAPASGRTTRPQADPVVVAERDRKGEEPDLLWSQNATTSPP